MKNRIGFIFILFLLFSINSKVSANELCSPNGFTVLTVNGIFTNKEGATDNKRALERKLLISSYNNEPLTVDFLYNATHLAGAQDLVDSAAQGLFNPVNDYDFLNILNDASQKVTTQKVLIVGHSQGNFYANNLYDSLASKPGGVPDQSIGVYSVATPSDHVAGGGKYLTSDTDSVIIGKVGGMIPVLAPNIHIPLQNGDGNGHSFSDIYLKYKGDKIVSDIKSSLDKLKENDEQDTQSPCISPPELGVAHDLAKGFYTVVDPTANVVKVGLVNSYSAGVYIANGAYSIGGSIGSIFHNTGLALGKAVSGLLANAVNSLPDPNTIAATLPMNLPESVNDNSPKEQMLPPVSEEDTTKTDEPIPVSEENINTAGSSAEAVTPEVVSEIPQPSILHGNNSAGSSSATPPSVSGVPVVEIPVISSFTTTDSTNTIIDENLKTISMTVPFGTDVKNITPNIIHNGISVNPQTGVVVDFTNPITYTVTSQDSSTKNYVVTVIVSPNSNPKKDLVISHDYLDIPDNLLAGGVLYFSPTYLGNYSRVWYYGQYPDVSNPFLFSNSLSSMDLQTLYCGQICTLEWNRRIPTYYWVGIYKDLVFENPVHFTEVYDTAIGPDFHRFNITNQGNVTETCSDSIKNQNETGIDVGGICSLKDITKFSIVNLNPVVDGVVDENNHTISLVVPFGTDVTSLVVNFTHRGKSAIPQSSSNTNFTKPVTYTVTARDSSAEVYTATVTVASAPASSQKMINSFNFENINPNIVGVVNETNHTVSLTVPFGTDVTKLIPTISISEKATIIPGNNTSQDFSSPVNYMVTAENSSTQNYVVTVTILPNSNNGPDTTPPSILNYAFNGAVGDVTINPLTNHLNFVLSASENVNWMSVKIEKQDDVAVYKLFQSGAGCVDGTNTCTKTWDGLLSKGGLLESQNGIYRIRVHMKDLNNNEFYDYLIPYKITVNTN